MVLPYTEIRAAIGELTKSIDKSKNLDLSTAALNLQSIVSQLMSENDDLEHENKRLKSQLADAYQDQIVRSKLVKYRGIWVSDEETRSEIESNFMSISDAITEKMYCPRCYGKDSKLISLNGRLSRYDSGYGFYVECPVCGFSTVLYPGK